MEVVGADFEVVDVLVVPIQTNVECILDLVEVGVRVVGHDVLVGLVLDD